MLDILMMMPLCVVGVLILYFLIIRPLLALGEIPYEIHKLRDALMAQKIMKDEEHEPQVQEKTGYWIDEADKTYAKYGRHSYKCSKCGKYAGYFVSGTEVKKVTTPEQQPCKDTKKTGWHIALGKFVCSCGYIRVIDDTDVIEWRYCPVCGGAKEVKDI